MITWYGGDVVGRSEPSKFASFVNETSIAVFILSDHKNYISTCFVPEKIAYAFNSYSQQLKTEITCQPLHCPQKKC